MKKRILSILLVVCMVVTLFPTVVMAASCIANTVAAPKAVAKKVKVVPSSARSRPL